MRWGKEMGKRDHKHDWFIWFAAAVLPEPMMYLEPPPCWSKLDTSCFKRDLST